LFGFIREVVAVYGSATILSENLSHGSWKHMYEYFVFQLFWQTLLRFLRFLLPPSSGRTNCVDGYLYRVFKGVKIFSR